MKLFLDTASLEDIAWAAQAGLIDGVTTNPSLLAAHATEVDQFLADWHTLQPPAKASV